MACQYDGNAGEHTRRRCLQGRSRVVLAAQYVQRACSTTARTHVLSDMLLGVGCEAATALRPHPVSTIDFATQKLGGKGSEAEHDRSSFPL